MTKRERSHEEIMVDFEKKMSRLDFALKLAGVLVVVIVAATIIIIYWSAI